ncbi:MAG: M48 family metalloprotease [Xanthomonadales bacterium]|nr:M48 family metalloprotease [Xanthomonadales bacterium]
MRKTILICALFLAGCQVNPVTGERNLQFYGSDWEQEVGGNYYAPMRQAQGGDYRLDPSLTQYVQEVGQKLAAQARRKQELNFEFQVLNDSTPNAWALPGGKIAINRGLLTELQSEAELAAVLGHEIVHADAAHGARAQSKGVLTQVGALAGRILIDSKVDSTAGRQVAAIVPALGAQLIQSKYGRDAEREADQYGMQYMSEAGYDPQGAVELQETFVRLSEGRNSDWLNGLFASHPPSQERVELNRETAAELPPGGTQGRERYQQELAYLHEVKPAYEAYDKAMVAAREEDFGTAREELRTALRIEPREALFHALQGDLEAEAGDRREALQSFERAVELDSAFFYHLLRRGQLRLELGREADARADLERSLELLPTAQAHYLLGNLDRDAGKRDAARAHYEAASRSNTEAGVKAERELISMDIGSNPGQYVATGNAADGSGNVYCLVGNRTRAPLDGITVTVAFVDDSGQTRRFSRELRDALPGGEQASIATGLRTGNTANLNQRLACTVSRARLAN